MKTITFTIEDTMHAKLLLKTWYIFLNEQFQAKKISSEQIDSLIQTPLMYNQKNDILELNLAGPEQVLKEFQSVIKKATEKA